MSVTGTMLKQLSATKALNIYPSLKDLSGQDLVCITNGKQLIKTDIDSLANTKGNLTREIIDALGPTLISERDIFVTQEILNYSKLEEMINTKKDDQIYTGEIYTVTNVNRNHWCLVTYNQECRRITLRDPLNKLNYQDVINLPDIRKITNLVFDQSKGPIHWIVFKNHPIQQNSHDCGVHVLTMVNALSNNLCMDYSDDTIAHFRLCLLSILISESCYNAIDIKVSKGVNQGFNISNVSTYAKELKSYNQESENLTLDATLVDRFKKKKIKFYWPEGPDLITHNMPAGHPEIEEYLTIVEVIKQARIIYNEKSDWDNLSKLLTDNPQLAEIYAGQTSLNERRNNPRFFFWGKYLKRVARQVYETDNIDIRKCIHASTPRERNKRTRLLNKKQIMKQKRLRPRAAEQQNPTQPQPTSRPPPEIPPCQDASTSQPGGSRFHPIQLRNSPIQEPQEDPITLD